MPDVKMTGPQRGFLSQLEARVDRLEKNVAGICWVFIVLFSAAVSLHLARCGEPEARPQISAEPQP